MAKGKDRDGGGEGRRHWETGREGEKREQDIGYDRTHGLII